MRRVARGLAIMVVTGVAALVSAPAAVASPGTDFWLGFPDAFDGPSPTHRVLITATDGASGTASIPGTLFSEGFNVAPGVVTTVDLPASVELTAADTVTAGRGVRVTADKPISVRGFYESQGLSDGYLGLATAVLGTEYRVLDYPGNAACGKAQFEVVGTQAGTTVTIVPSVAIEGHSAGTPYEITLGGGSAYLGRATGTSSTAGTRISADKPIAVLAGNNCGEVPVGTSFANFLVEQLPPVSAWGTSFSILPFSGRTAGDELTLLGSQDETSLTIAGAAGTPPGAPLLLGAGQAASFTIDESIRIEASKPVLVAHFAKGREAESSAPMPIGDPTMVLVPPSQRHAHSQTIATPSSGFAQYHVNVTIASADLGSLRLDGALVPAASFSAVGGNSSISGAALPITADTHTLTSDGPFGAEVYGFADTDAFGWMGAWGDGSRAPSPSGGPPASPADSSPTAKCRVPKLKKKRLRSVKKILRRRGCRLGKVKRRRGVTAKKGRVVAQKPRPGVSLPTGGKVAVTLGA